MREVLLDADVGCLAAYNAAFDAPVIWCSLRSGMQHAGVGESLTLLRGADGETWPVGCAMRGAALALNPPGRMTLRAVCDWLEVPLLDAHDAGADSRAAAEVLCRALNRTGREPLRLFGFAYGGLLRFTRRGPEQAGRHMRSRAPSGVLAGVARDGRLIGD